MLHTNSGMFKSSQLLVGIFNPVNTSTNATTHESCSCKQVYGSIGPHICFSCLNNIRRVGGWPGCGAKHGHTEALNPDNTLRQIQSR